MQFSVDVYSICNVVDFNLLFPKIDTHLDNCSKLQETESVCPTISYSRNKADEMCDDTLYDLVLSLTWKEIPVSLKSTFTSSDLSPTDLQINIRIITNIMFSTSIKSCADSSLHFIEDTAEISSILKI